MPETERERIPQQRRAPITFVQLSGAYWGEGADQRSWHVAPTEDVWRLAYFDVEVEEPVVVGTYPTAEKAQQRAGAATAAHPAPTAG
jgi:hypothetical protein